MWNSQKPLELLLSMPSTLNKENIINLQAVIDVDKIINSQIHNRDLCGEYAPFCDFCDKNLSYPCAHAYVKMKQSEGLDVEVAQEVFEEDAAPAPVDEPAEVVIEEPIQEKEVNKGIRICQLRRKR